MKMRVAVGRFWTETHSFSPLPISRAMFECGLLVEGDAVLNSLRGTRSEVGGFLSVLDDEPVEVLPTLAAQSMCGGPIERPVWQEIRDGILRRLAEVQPVDGVLLSCHGATEAVGEEDCVGVLLREVRHLVGPDVPLVATLDMHANPTRQMVENATALVAYKTYPHHDFFERGQQAARLLLRTVRGEVEPVMVATSLPLAVGQAIPVQLDRIADGIELEESGQVLACSVLSTHYYMDVAEFHPLTALIVTDGDRASARRVGQEMMWRAWQDRQRVKDALQQAAGLPLAEAVERALSFPPGTVVMADWGDAVTGGYPGDDASLIAHLLERGIEEPACLIINDPDLVQRAMAAGVGRPVAGPIGGRWGGRFYRPVTVDGRVRLLFDGVLPPSREEQPGHLVISNTSMGPTAVVQVGQTITVVATSVPVSSTEPTVFRAVGVEPADYRLVLVKAVRQQRMHFAPIAVGFVEIADGRYGFDTHTWRARDPNDAYPYKEFTDAEIRRILELAD